MYRIEITGDRVLVKNLDQYDKGISDRALPKALKAIGRDVVGKATELLTGNRTGVKTLTSKNDIERTVRTNPSVSGAYPVTIFTGNLRRLAGMVNPGETVSSDDRAGGEISYTAGPEEVIIFNSAFYASMIHEGLGSSEKYGARPFLDDAIEAIHSSGNMDNRIIEELEKEKINSGLG